MHAQKREWPDDLDLADAPVLVRSLAQQRLWMEQKRLVLDPRLLDAMDKVLARSR